MKKKDMAMFVTLRIRLYLCNSNNYLGQQSNCNYFGQKSEISQTYKAY